MKSKARSHFWWPKLDQDIEAIASKCHQFIQARPNPAKSSPSPWPRANYVYQRIHIDFCGPVANKMFLVVLDSLSKWVKLFSMHSITSTATIEKLRECFARFGLPETIVSDNGPLLTSQEFSTFCSKNGIEHLTTAAYKPQSNGAAENAVKTFKCSMQKALTDPNNKNISVETIMIRFLFYYRSSVHSATLETPYQLMFGREMKTHFDRINPKRLIEMCNQTTTSSTTETSHNIRNDEIFAVNDQVLVRDHQNPKHPWKNAIVTAVIGKRMHKCKTEEGEWRRHVDQILPCKSVNCSRKIYNNDYSVSYKRFSINEESKPANDVEPSTPSSNAPAANENNDDTSDDEQFADASDDELQMQIQEEFIADNSAQPNTMRPVRIRNAPERLEVDPKRNKY